MRKLYGAEQHRIPRIEHGERPRTDFVTLHDTESDNLIGVVNYFATSSPDEVGAPIIIGPGGRTLQLADLDALVYHAKGANSNSIGIEICGYASQSKARWLKRRKQRVAIAKAVARLCHMYRLGSPRYGNNVKTHADIPAGGHHDPGVNFPLGKVMKLAQRYYRKWYQ